jgi:hypothetical protein
MTSPTRPIACESELIMRDRAEIVQDVFGGDRLAPDAALGEGHVLGDAGVEVMAHHQHVEVLVQRVDGERPRRIGRRRQHVGLADALMMSGACPPPAPSVWNVWMVRPLNAADHSRRSPTR